jgi:hypothetical protein
VTRERGNSDQAWIDEVRAVWAHSDLVEPPSWVRDRAKRLFRTRTLAVPRSNALVSRLRATLLFDSRRQGLAAPVGVRSGVVSGGTRPGPWQLLYRGGDVDVDLLVRPNQDGRTSNVRGQALSLVGASFGSGFVEAMPSDAPHHLRSDEPRSPFGAARPVRSSVDASGEFALPNLERGRYHVLLRFGAQEIELSDVEL